MTPTKHAELAPLMLFALAAACTAASAVHALAGGLLPMWALCTQLMGMAGQTFREPVWIGLGLLLLIGLGRLAIRFWKTRCFIGQVNTATLLNPGGRLPALVDKLHLSPFTVVLPTEVPLAFCYGLLRPRICLSTGLVKLLTEHELEAVLRHEDHHRRRHDPLRRLLLEAVAALLFFLPIAAELCELLITDSELQADRYAVRAVGRGSLASALHKMLLHQPSIRMILPVASGFDAISARIAVLVSGRPSPVRLSARSLVTSSVALMLVCMLAL